MSDSIQISVRVDGRLVERADELLDLVAEETGRAASRAEVWREALIRGIKELEKLRARR